MPVYTKKQDGFKRINIEISHAGWKGLKLISLIKDMSIADYVTVTLEKHAKKHSPVKETETNVVEGLD